MEIRDNNLKLLTEKYPEIMKEINELQDDAPELEVFSSQYYGLPTGKYRGIHLHSAYDPVHEACYWASGYDFDRDYLLFQIGFGMGYHAKATMEAMDKRAVLVILILDLGLFSRLLSSIDYSDLLSHDRILFFHAASPEFPYRVLYKLLSAQSLIRSVNIRSFLPEEVLMPELCRNTRHIVINQIRYSTMLFGNDPGDTLIGLKNILDNSRHIIEAPIMQISQSVPAICVAAGPSLDKQLPLLQKCKGKALILCADTIAHKLILNGIQPDIIGALERDREVYDRFFEGKDYGTETVFLGQCVVDPRVFNSFRGPKIVSFRQPTIFERSFACWSGGFLLDPGMSVAHLNAAYAVAMGCDPVILIGQDLAYGPEGQTHAKQTVYNNEASNEFDPTSGTQDIWLDGYYGSPVRSHTGWKMFLDWFELAIIKWQTSSRVINATEGGARISGATQLTFQDTYDQYVKNNTLNFSLLHKSPEKRLEICHNYLSNMNAFIEEVNDFNAEACKAKSLIADLEALVKNKVPKKISSLNTYIIPINDCINRMNENRMTAFIIQALYMTLGRENNNIGSIESESDLMRWLTIQRSFIVMLQGVMEKTLEILNGGILLLRELEEEYVQAVQ